MAGTIFTQTDTSATHGDLQACAVSTTATTRFNREIKEGATAGTGTGTVLVTDTTVRRGVHFESAINEPGTVKWQFGDYTCRLNVTTGDSDVVLDTVKICRVNNAGVNQATVGTLGSLSEDMTAGLKTHVVSGSSMSAAVNDRLVVIYEFHEKSGAHGTNDIIVTNDQDIDTPIGAIQDAVGMGVVPFAR